MNPDPDRIIVGQWIPIRIQLGQKGPQKGNTLDHSCFKELDVLFGRLEASPGASKSSSEVQKVYKVFLCKFLFANRNLVETKILFQSKEKSLDPQIHINVFTKNYLIVIVLIILIYTLQRKSHFCIPFPFQTQFPHPFDCE
jgi:hypothetical protein